MSRRKTKATTTPRDAYVARKSFTFGGEAYETGNTFPSNAATERRLRQLVDTRHVALVEARAG